MSVPASQMSNLSTLKAKKNVMVLSGLVASVDEHMGLQSGKEVYVYRIQLPSPDGFRGGSRQIFITEKKNAYRVGDAFEETVVPSGFNRRYEHNGEIRRSQFPDACFELES